MCLHFLFPLSLFSMFLNFSLFVYILRSLVLLSFMFSPLYLSSLMTYCPTLYISPPLLLFSFFSHNILYFFIFLSFLYFSVNLQAVLFPKLFSFSSSLCILVPFKWNWIFEGTVGTNLVRIVTGMMMYHGPN